MNSHHACCEPGHIRTKPWYRHVLFLTFAGTVFFLTATYFAPQGETVRSAFLDYLRLMWWAVALGLCNAPTDL